LASCWRPRVTRRSARWCPLNDIILKRHELKLPIPLSLKPRWDTLQTQRSTLEMKLAEAKARATRLAGELATTVKRGDELRQQVIKGLPVAIATLVLFLLALWTATTRSILAARRADDFPIARFALTYVESVGWQLVTTLTLLPVGLLVVALSQWGLVPLAIHHTLRGPREPESLGAEETPPSAP